MLPEEGNVNLTKNQLDLLGADPALPEGFRYQPDIVSPEDEQTLLKQIRELPLKEFEFHGYTAKRRVISYGWQYDFNERTLRRTDDIPLWLLALRETAAEFAGLAPKELQQVLVMEYNVGAGIGWHRDKAVFGDVVGISLLAPARFR
jgi:alkylated DNA repair dioxygenase AlkB